MKGLAGKVEALHRRLAAGGIPHAFGGALALAFCVGEPRATADIDVNVFVSPMRARDVFASMPRGVVTTKRDEERALDRGQVRIRWNDTPIDLFFAYHEFHGDAARRTRMVPFGAIEIPVLDCGDLVVFKAIFGRPQDWVDIQNMLESGGTEINEPLERLASILGRDDPACDRLASMGDTRPDEADAYRRAFGVPEDRDR